MLARLVQEYNVLHKLALAELKFWCTSTEWTVLKATPGSICTSHIHLRILKETAAARRTQLWL